LSQQSGQPPTITALNPDTGVAGVPDFDVTVQGSNFDKDSAVVVDGNPRDSTVLSDTEMTYVTHSATAEAGHTYQVTVRNASGESNAVTFTYTEAPVMVVLRVAGLPFNESFTYEGVVITRDGTEVPESAVNACLAAAQIYGMPLEVAE
jgi:hypothetical protein